MLEEGEFQNNKKNTKQRFYNELKKALGTSRSGILNIIVKRDEEDKKGWIEIHELLNIIRYNVP
jgi:hypothetical protein